MKALVFNKFGKAETVLKLKEVAEPEPGPGEVKVKMLLSPINPSDIYNTIEGTYVNAVSRTIWNYQKKPAEFTVDPEGKRKLPGLPHTPGLEGVGMVVAAGPGKLGKMLVGKRVACLGGKKGNWQEYNILPAKQALSVARNLPDEQAAMSFVNPVTALAMIRKVLKPKKGSWLMQSAANSELGKMIIKLGQHFGFKTINLVRKDEQIEGLRKLGADEVINIKKQDLKAEVQRITAGAGAPYALDPIAGKLASEMVQCMSLGGRFLVYGTLSSQNLNFSSRDLMTPVCSIEGFFLTNWLATQNLASILLLTRQVGKLMQKDILTSQVSAVYDLKDYKKALVAAKKAGNTGKILLRLVQ